MQTKKDFSLKKLVLLALLIAVNVAVSRIFIIPVPLTHGSVNLCDAIILLVALIFGPSSGIIVGGLSGFLLDLLSGYGQFMFFSLIVHGLEGLIAGLINQYLHLNKYLITAFIAGLVGIVVMVAGYCLTDTILYTWSAGFAGIFTNTIQGLVGLLIALVLLPKLRKLLPKFI
ncbi:ECF transporter S component [Lactobacillus sp. ESL0791]|uniref:ECF transporter S component n=1 Tax=Lactobacillus sp. ESL0791 TaxID=2983234 RepID=UPI0023F776F4|nr:ECF transporter S component [Lactobacillus sp. ESL0791]MDF7639459.1 ECF transporter S component [Lactobacillus sp. ESL0791]